MKVTTFLCANIILLSGITSFLEFSDSTKNKTNIPVFEYGTPSNRNHSISFHSSFSIQYFRHLLAFTFAIEEINLRSDILPNITLGFQAHDSGPSEALTMERALRILSGGRKVVENFSCSKQGKIVAFIGHLLSSPSYALADILSVYKYIQVSYGALDPVFDDKTRFPHFFRTVPCERSQYMAIIQLLRHFNWNWVGIITDDINIRASEEMKLEIIRNGSCVEFMVNIQSTKESDINKCIYRSSANVIILHSNMAYCLHIMGIINKHKDKKFMWIATTAFNYQIGIRYVNIMQSLNGSLWFVINKGEIPGLKDYLQNINPSKQPENSFLPFIWNLFIWSATNQSSKYHLQSLKNQINLKNLDSFQYDVNNFRNTYAVYSAVYSVAHALHDMTKYQSQRKKSRNKRDQQDDPELFKLRHYMQRVNFATKSGEVVFNDKGNVLGHFDIMNYITYPHNVNPIINLVGNFNEHASSGVKLRIDTKKIQWNTYFTRIPNSTCTKSCLPGYRKATRQGNQICCYDCVRCSEGEITNSTDMDNCEKCPEDQWSNENMDKCVPKEIEFLSFHDILGIILTVTSLLFCAVATGVSAIIFIHRHMQIVRANNRVLSYILLACLILSFLCCLLFIGQPGDITCLLRQISFGLIFAVALSTILGKTVTVIIAFNATKPGSKMKKLVGTKVSKMIVVSKSLGQVCICTVWLICSPPFPDAVSETGKIVLECNEGSALAFYIMVGYIGVLALISFALAYFARTLPDIYNEAQLITFSMLVFCSVWIAFIPAYLSTKGKYMVAVEIFTILTSSAGLLGCIFFPKCYIIILKHKLNSKELKINK